MTFRRWTAIALTIVGVMCVTGVTGTGCVSPFYGTARIEKGLRAEVGASVMTYIGAPVEYNEPSVGIAGDIALSYGFNPYLQIGTRLGLCYGQSGFLITEADNETRVNPWDFYPDVALHLQTAISCKKLTPALRIDGSLSHGLSTALLMGFGNPEKLTLGLRGNAFGTPYPYGFDVFLVVRPVSRLSFFAGLVPYIPIEDGKPWPIATLGIGYSIK
jgi:hypothetical protein